MFCAGAPCRDWENAFIFAAMSEVSPLASAGGGPGRRAALIWPSGAEEAVMVFDAVPSFALRSDGSLAGEGYFCNGADWKAFSDVGSGWFSTSEGCKPCFSDT